MEKGKAPEAEKPAEVGPDPYAGGSLAQLTFKLPLNYRAAEQLVTTAIEEAQAPHRHDPLPALEPRICRRRSKAYKEWDLKIMLPPEKTESAAEGLQAAHCRQPDLSRHRARSARPWPATRN